MFTSLSDSELKGGGSSVSCSSSSSVSSKLKSNGATYPSTPVSSRRLCRSLDMQLCDMHKRAASTAPGTRSKAHDLITQSQVTDCSSTQSNSWIHTFCSEYLLLHNNPSCPYQHNVPQHNHSCKGSQLMPKLGYCKADIGWAAFFQNPIHKMDKKSIPKTLFYQEINKANIKFTISLVLTLQHL